MTNVMFSQMDDTDKVAFEVDEEGRVFLDLKKLSPEFNKISIVGKTDFLHIFTTSNEKTKDKMLHVISFNKLEALSPSENPK